MANGLLYAPIVDSYVPAFEVGAGTGYCRLYFSLSKYSAAETIKGVQISIVQQSSGQSVVNKNIDGSDRFRYNGILTLSSKYIKSAENNQFYVDILNEDIKDGWKKGTIYQMQIRFLSMEFDIDSRGIGNKPKSFSAWVSRYSNFISEWSSYCTSKAIGVSTVSISTFGYNEQKSHLIYNYTLEVESLKIVGSYLNEDETESLYSYRWILYKENGEIYEDSGTQFASRNINKNNINYNFKRNLITDESHEYTLKLYISTRNKFTQTRTFELIIKEPAEPNTEISCVTLENYKNTKNNDFINNFNSTLGEEEDGGYVFLKLYDKAVEKTKRTLNIAIKRTSEKSNFLIWDTIKIINCVDGYINDLPPVLDTTIENNIKYIYGVLILNDSNSNSRVNTKVNSDDKNFLVSREIEYAYLCGDDKILKLELSNNISSISYNKADAKIEAIGGKYPFITRNGYTDYKSFQVTGIIASVMDKNNLFYKKDLPAYLSLDYYDQESLDNTIANINNYYLYDEKREYDFREEVLKFLQNGEPKLFKSATEGNLICMITNITIQPIQSLNRSICNFSFDVCEIADFSLENCVNLNIFSQGEEKELEKALIYDHIGGLIVDPHYLDDRYDLLNYIRTKLEELYVDNSSPLKTRTRFISQLTIKPLRPSNYQDVSLQERYTINTQEFYFVPSMVLGSNQVISMPNIEYGREDRMIFPNTWVLEISCDYVMETGVNEERPLYSLINEYKYDILNNITLGTNILERIKFKQRYYSGYKDSSFTKMIWFDIESDKYLKILLRYEDDSIETVYKNANQRSLDIAVTRLSSEMLKDIKEITITSPNNENAVVNIHYCCMIEHKNYRG